MALWWAGRVAALSCHSVRLSPRPPALLPRFTVQDDNNPKSKKGLDWDVNTMAEVYKKFGLDENTQVWRAGQNGLGCLEWKRGRLEKGICEHAHVHSLAFPRTRCLTQPALSLNRLTHLPRARSPHGTLHC